MAFKKLITSVALASLLIPQLALATLTVPMVATSTTQGWVFPSRINGSEQSLLSQNFVATSTSLANIFPNLFFTSATGTAATTTNFFSTSLFGTTGNLTNLFFTSATGTSATTTNLAVSGLSSKIPYAFPNGSIGALSVGTGLTLLNGTLSNSATASFAYPFTTLTGSGNAQATSTTLAFLNGFLSTASSTMASTTVTSLLATNSTTTELYVSNIASTTNFRSNIGTIGNLTVTSCTGCSSAGMTLYTATSTTNRYMAKTLNLVSGDTVTWWGSGIGNNCGVMAYRISSPNSNSSTTVMNDGTCSDDARTAFNWAFLATTTETVTFDFQAGNAGNSSMILMLQNTGYGNAF